MCVCHTRNTGSCRSAGESECAVLGRSVCLCVCVIQGIPVAVGLLERVSVCVGQVRLSVSVSCEECRVVVSLLERVSVWCWAGPSVCVCVTRNAE